MAIKRANLKLTSAQGAEDCLKLRPKGGLFQNGNVYAWRTGQSGNPAGRPKDTTLTAALRRKLAEVDVSDPQRRTYAELIADYLVRLAAGSAGSGTSSVLAAREIANRTEGRPRQAAPLTVEDARQMLATFLGCSVDELPLPEDLESS